MVCLSKSRPVHCRKEVTTKCYSIGLFFSEIMNTLFLPSGSAHSYRSTGMISRNRE